MRKRLRYLAFLLMAGIFSLSSSAQAPSLSGTVKNAGSKEPIPSVSVIVKGSQSGTLTDDRGNFRLSTTQKTPFTLILSSVGFETREISVNSLSETLELELTPGSSLGSEVVVSASRVPERILESPVTIERISAANIRTSPAASFYDIVGNLKGVDITTSSLNFKTPSTRGFVGSGNLRFNQLVDGMDNQAPGLNFSLGGFIGLSELDVDNIELLPGASSALYGPGGMNGTLLINSKNPFKYQGVSFIVKQGLMNADSKFRRSSMYNNWTLRWAEKISDKFAFKVTTELIQAKDWLAADYRNYKRTGTTGIIGAGTRESDPNYDGVNVYGDETTADIRQVLTGIAGQAPFLAPYIASISGSAINVSRTGYQERDIVDPNTVNYKISGALHYKLTPGIEAILQGNLGTGSTVYTGSDRYSLRDLKMGQYKLEFNSQNWFVRAYTTQENAGQSFNATVTTRLLNELWKPSAGPANNPTSGWFFQYGQAYLASKLAGLTDAEAHSAGRATADVGRPAANSPQFKTLFDQIRSKPISQGGGLFVDKTNLYNIEGQYNLSYLTSRFANLIVGGNFKRYVLNSEGTLFADSAGKIGINEVGFYAQANRSLLNDKLRLTVSGRYDKNSNFKGRFTPRATAVINLAPNSNLRLSYQTAYRFPSTQQQWINLNVGGGVQLIGGVKELQEFFKFSTNPVFPLTGGTTPIKFAPFKPESVRSYEIGYKSLIAKKLLIDLYGYYGQYKDFIGRTLVAQPSTGRIFSVPTNTTTKVQTYGAGISLDYSLPAGFIASGNVSTDRLEKLPVGFISFFNAPKYRTNLSLSNSGFGPGKKFGFSVVYKWQDSFFYEGDFANGDVQSINTVDAQISFKLPKKSVVKIGANNLLNQYYINAVGNPYIGGLYYVSYGYNVFQ
jgi:outer membrane receptor protein involved in Fe transport